MVSKTAVKLLGAGGIVLGVALMVGSAWATNMFSGFQTCTGLNCGAASINGTVVGGQFGNNNPWTAEIFAGQNECLRIAVTAESQDLELVVRAPNGTVYRNDDGLQTCTNCPVVKIPVTPNRGWYAVSINHWLGTAVYSDFTMRYQRYNLGNPNCAGGGVEILTPQRDGGKNSNGREVSPQLEQEGTTAQ